MEMGRSASGDGAPPPPGLNHSNSNTFDDHPGEHDDFGDHHHGEVQHHANVTHPDLDLRNSIAENDDDDEDDPEDDPEGELPVGGPEPEIQPPPTAAAIENFNTTTHD